MSTRRRAPRSALQEALALLTRREHSQFELAAKLRTRGHSSDEIETALAKLMEDGWQSDARFADSLVRHRAASGYGPRWMRAELATHKLDDALIAAAVDGFAGDWPALAQDLLTRRGLAPPAAGAPWPLAQKRKALELLTRRGFEHLTIMAGFD